MLCDATAATSTVWIRNFATQSKTTRHKTKDRVTRTPLKTGDELSNNRTLCVSVMYSVAAIH